MSANTASLQALPCHHHSQVPSAHPACPELLSVTRVRGDCCSKLAPFRHLGRTAVSTTGFVPWRGVRCGGAGSCSEKESVVDVEEIECGGDEGDAWLVDEATTPFNHISVLELDEAADHELAGAYVLKLDGADLAHSVFWGNGRVWSGGCHDVFASLPPLLPEGPIGILGLGAGTVARLLLHVWPNLQLQGWELDPEVVRVGRQYFGLTDLESPPQHAQESKKAARTTGRLVVHVGDALGSQATVKGGFAGIMVDIFINGAVCEELAQVRTWRKLKKRLRSGGRVMVNCIPNGKHLLEEDSVLISREWDELMHRIVRAMDVVFPGEVSVRELTDGNNVMLLSGELPDAETWSLTVPDRLAEGVHEWRLWDESHPLYRKILKAKQK